VWFDDWPWGEHWILCDQLAMAAALDKTCILRYKSHPYTVVNHLRKHDQLVSAILFHFALHDIPVHWCRTIQDTSENGAVHDTEKTQV
jgi:hypothetical protein